MNEPKKEVYGYIEARSPEEESGWCIEGGEEEYYRDLAKYKQWKRNTEIKSQHKGLQENLCRASERMNEDQEGRDLLPIIKMM
jgi:hypothetical protein